MARKLPYPPDRGPTTVHGSQGIIERFSLSKKADVLTRKRRPLVHKEQIGSEKGRENEVKFIQHVQWLIDNNFLPWANRVKKSSMYADLIHGIDVIIYGIGHNGKKMQIPIQVKSSAHFAKLFISRQRNRRIVHVVVMNSQITQPIDLIPILNKIYNREFNLMYQPRRAENPIN